MEKLNKKYNDLVSIHKTLATSIKKYQEVMNDKTIDLETQEAWRDSTIKRFELTYDLLWKYLREYISAVQGATVDAPRKVFQQCLSLGLTTEQETAQLVDLIEDRNLTTHTYNIDLANEVAADIPNHYDIIHGIIMKLSPDIIEN